MARPSKLTPELEHALCLHLSYGATHKAAAAAEGIDEKTFYNWLKRPRFFQSVCAAEARARTEKLRLLHVAACRGNVQAITWLLERLEPQAYAEPAKRVALEGKDGGDLVVRVIYDDNAGGTAESGSEH